MTCSRASGLGQGFAIGLPRMDKEQAGLGIGSDGPQGLLQLMGQPLNRPVGLVYLTVGWIGLCPR